jgi:hypothetical protein
MESTKLVDSLTTGFFHVYEICDETLFVIFPYVITYLCTFHGHFCCPNERLGGING